MIYADNVKETTTGTSAASITTAGAVTNYVPFSVFTVGQTNIAVKVGPDSSGAWLLGAYTYSAANTLTRTAILSSSAGGTTDVTFAAGSKEVTCTYSATKIVDVENAVTLTNKRISARISTVNAPGATPSVNTDLYDRLHLTGLAAAITSITVSGTPLAGDQLAVELTDNGTARVIAWGASFEPSGNVALPTTTVAGAKLSVYFERNATTSAWRCVGVA